MKKGQLYDWHHEIKNWKRSGSILCVFFADRINAFYKTYGKQLDDLLKEIQALDLLWYEFEDGKPKIGPDNKLVLLPGKTAEEANKAFQALMMEMLPEKSALVIVQEVPGSMKKPN